MTRVGIDYKLIQLCWTAVDIYVNLCNVYKVILYVKKTALVGNVSETVACELETRRDSLTQRFPTSHKATYFYSI